MKEVGLSRHYYGNAYEHTELSTPIHIWEHETSTMGNYHCPGFVDEEQLFFQEQSALLDQPISLPSFKESLAAVTTNAAVVNGAATEASVNALTSIPFVQIHTTDLQRPDKNYHNVFRRRTEIIKAEPIKSEAAEAAKERINSTPTPPARNVSNCTSLEGKPNVDLQNNVNLSSVSNVNFNPVPTTTTTTTTSSTTTHEVYKCATCPFLCLTQAALNAHLEISHTAAAAAAATDYNRQQLACPGCSNIFYSHKSLDIHLREDHLMHVDEVSSLLLSLLHNQSAAVAVGNKSIVPVTQTNVEQSNETKSRIFIKNVDCLREPATPSSSQMEMLPIPKNNSIDDNLLANYNQTTQLNGNNNKDDISMLELTAAEMNVSQITTEDVIEPKQKISIKSVDVLREPLIQNDAYTMQYNMLPSVMDTTTKMNNHNSGLEYGSNGNETNSDEYRKTRRPKIYIKNVDILREPMLFPSNLNAINLQNMNFNFGTTNNMTQHASSVNNGVGTYQNETTELITPDEPNGFDNNLQNINRDAFHYQTGQSVSNSHSNSSNCDFLDNFDAVPPNNGNNFNIMDNTRFMNDLDTSFLYSDAHISLPTNMPTTTPSPSTVSLPTTTTTTPVSISSTPDIEQCLLGATIEPTLSQQLSQQIDTHTQFTDQKHKIFIKNANIMKAPQFQLPEQEQHQRGTLHLRTVDELNLMNRNEVEDLLAPSNLHATLPNGATKGLETAQLDTSFASAFVNGWSNEDYDLGDDLDCIITDTIDPLINMTNANENKNCNTETEQKKMIDMEFKENQQNQIVCSNSNISVEMDSLTQMAEDILNEDLSALYPPLQTEQVAVQNTINQSPKIEYNILPLTLPATNVANLTEIPPLVPVTTTTTATFSVSSVTDTSAAMVPCLTSIPVPPLVPYTRPLNGKRNEKAKSKKNTESSSGAGAAAASANKASTSTEKPARIYVANNLLSKTTNTAANTDLTQSLSGGTSIRGRPYGAKRMGISKVNATIDTQQVGLKCTVNGCAFRFKIAATLEYHKRCHNNTTAEVNSTVQSMICPECKSTGFNHWNSLHTHLWRTHQIDMELYRCPQCTFRTPIYSRLINTHSKIHLDERNYKCEICGKAFKNTKQLKNHRRLHRTLKRSTTAAAEADTETKFYRCESCGSAFSHLKTLNEHFCKNREEQLQCNVCQSQFSSKSSLKLHMLTHESSKRFKCDDCNQYETNDHNAFRRHKMTHQEQARYLCTLCDGKFIQSSSYQRHIQQKHPEHVTDLLHKCSHCQFTTINRSLLVVHQAKHENVTTIPVTTTNTTHDIASVAAVEVTSETDKVVANVQSSQNSKIKAENNLLLAHSNVTLPNASGENVLNNFWQ